MQRAAQLFNGREGETATLFSRSLVNSELRGGGFAPRHLSRSPQYRCNVSRTFCI